MVVVKFNRIINVSVFIYYLQENSNWKEKYITNDLEWRKRTSILEQQLLKQRDKAQELVLEKERELNTLRETLHSTKYNRKTSHSSTGSKKEVSNLLYIFICNYIIILYEYGSRNIWMKNLVKKDHICFIMHTN